MKDLSKVSDDEQREFLNSFDQVISDVDGVIWLLGKVTARAPEAVSGLRKLGKQVSFLSNNSAMSTTIFHKLLSSAGFGNDNILINPVLAIISYLKSINFTKEVYVLGTQDFRNTIANAGFKVAEREPLLIEDNITTMLSHFHDNENVGAVIVDIDVNYTYASLQRAAIYLKRPDVIYITGAGDEKLPLAKDTIFIGPKYFQNAIEEISGRTPIALAKPSVKLNDCIIEKCGVKDTSKVLFIGDSIKQDMTFACNCGYRKLLVLSGITKMDEIENWTHHESIKPDYYLQNLGDLVDIINKFENS